jgi:hypothetical protein
MLKLLSALPGNQPIPLNCFSWPKVWLGLLLEKFLTIPGLILTMTRPDIRWAGVRYWKSRGRILRVQHPGPEASYQRLH